MKCLLPIICLGLGACGAGPTNLSCYLGRSNTVTVTHCRYQVAVLNGTRAAVERPGQEPVVEVLGGDGAWHRAEQDCSGETRRPSAVRQPDDVRYLPGDGLDRLRPGASSHFRVHGITEVALPGRVKVTARYHFLDTNPPLATAPKEGWVRADGVERASRDARAMREWPLERVEAAIAGAEPTSCGIESAWNELGRRQGEAASQRFVEAAAADPNSILPIMERWAPQAYAAIRERVLTREHEHPAAPWLLPTGAWVRAGDHELRFLDELPGFVTAPDGALTLWADFLDRRSTGQPPASPRSARLRPDGLRTRSRLTFLRSTDGARREPQGAMEPWLLPRPAPGAPTSATLYLVNRSSEPARLSRRDQGPQVGMETTSDGAFQPAWPPSMLSVDGRWLPAGSWIAVSVQYPLREHSEAATVRFVVALPGAEPLTSNVGPGRVAPVGLAVARGMPPLSREALVRAARGEWTWGTSARARQANREWAVHTLAALVADAEPVLCEIGRDRSAPAAVADAAWSEMRGERCAAEVLEATAPPTPAIRAHALQRASVATKLRFLDRNPGPGNGAGALPARDMIEALDALSTTANIPPADPELRAILARLSVRPDLGALDREQAARALRRLPSVPAVSGPETPELRAPVSP